jgi:hypothetical protein
MKKLLQLFVIIIPIFIGSQLSIVNCCAQTSNGCIDSLYYNPTPICGSVYEPICACNGKTYRNQCFATSDGVVPGQYTFGPCEPLHYFFFPTLAVDFLNLNISVKAEGTVNIYIFDVYGNIKFFQDYYIGTPYILNLSNFDVSTFDKGVYVLVAETQGYYQLEKFVKIHHGDN